MAKPGRSIIGIDINPHEIRIAELRVTGKQEQIVQVSGVRTPAGTMNGDRITDSGAIATAIRGLLSRMSVSTRAAVIGIGPQTVITHVLDVPTVPDDEMRTVIEGELAHLHVLPSGTGAFDYMRMEASSTKADSNPQALVMAAETGTTTAASEVASFAGLQLVGLEPSLIAMYRAALSQLQGMASAAFVSLTYSKAEIAIIDHGQIRLYRRADIGTDEIMKGRKKPAAEVTTASIVPSRVMLGDKEDEAEPLSEEQASAGINNTKAGTLATEIRRSTEYFRREFPKATPISKIFLSSNDPEAAELAPWLQASLDTEVVLCAPSAAIHAIPSAALQLEPPGGLRYSAAVGLAMSGASAAALAPRFDLSTGERMAVQAEFSRKTLVFSGAICFFILVAGLMLTFALKRQVDTLKNELAVKQNEVRLKNKERVIRQADIREELDLVEQIQSQGFPIPSLMDEVSLAIDPEAGVTEVKLDATGMLTIQGEAANERAIVNTQRGMQSAKSFTGTLLENFEISKDDKRRIWKFKISSHLASAAPKPVAPAGQ
jgi:type IV pilus assembly protein PilM